MEESTGTLTDTSYKYFAFISYNSKDTEWGKRVQRKLEHYRMPATLCNENGWKRTPIKPVFFAPTDIQPGPLSEELQERLRASRNLIVICSPNSAQSEWVGREIAFFHSIGRTKNIHFFIVDGVPHSGDTTTECFNPVVKTLGLPEILGANIHEKVSRWSWINKERAYVQLISKLLDVEFDAIWQRHKRLLLEKTIAWFVGIMIVMATLWGVWFMNKPADVCIRQKEASAINHKLPAMDEAVITLFLDNERKCDTIRSIEATTTFTNIPQRYLGRDVRITVSYKDRHNHESFCKTDTLLRLDKNITLPVHRMTDVYGRIRFCIWDESGTPVKNKDVILNGKRLTSDDNGYINHNIPVEQQDTIYNISLPGTSQTYTISMPCGEDDIISIEN
ncbi:MAG: toll/interleukin-1 receptor domain-containing protein [Prevotella sp.]|nr:toll/interleukin-1 receptor domain-containing protein [Prevotella sp.]